MCDYCENYKTMMTTEVISRSNFGWGYDDAVKLTLSEAEEDPTVIGVFIDRGYLRMVDLNDCNCMDSGEKFKINFCPVCGDRLGGLDECP